MEFLVDTFKTIIYMNINIVGTSISSHKSVKILCFTASAILSLNLILNLPKQKCFSITQETSQTP